MLLFCGLIRNKLNSPNQRRTFNLSSEIKSDLVLKTIEMILRDGITIIMEFNHQ